MTHFTHEEQRTLMTLWSIAQAPLMFGGDLPSNNDFTLSLLDNDELLAVDQHGAGGYPISEAGSSIVWVANGGAGSKYFAVFNVGDHGPIDVRVEWQALGMPAQCKLRDVWERKDRGTIRGGQSFHLEPHASGIYKLTAIQ